MQTRLAVSLAICYLILDIADGSLQYLEILLAIGAPNSGHRERCLPMFADIAGDMWTEFCTSLAAFSDI